MEHRLNATKQDELDAQDGEEDEEEGAAGND